MSDDINRTSNPRCGAHFTAPIMSDVAAIFDPNSGVVPVTGSRDVSDPEPTLGSGSGFAGGVAHVPARRGDRCAQTLPVRRIGEHV